MNLSNRTNTEAIRVHIETTLMAPSLLIIDEAQHLGPKALEEARALFDAVEPLGVILMGNETVVSQMAGGGRDAMFAQLSSRAGMKYKVEPWPKEEVKEVVASYGIEAEKEIDFLFDVSRTHGALRKVDRVIRLARMIQPADEQDNLLPFLKTAAKQLSVTGAVA